MGVCMAVGHRCLAHEARNQFIEDSGEQKLVEGGKLMPIRDLRGQSNEARKLARHLELAAKKMDDAANWIEHGISPSESIAVVDEFVKMFRKGRKLLTPTLTWLSAKDTGKEC